MARLFECPRCGAAEAIRVDVVDAYDPDVNAGGNPEIVGVDCACEPLTAAEADTIEERAMADFNPDDYAPDDDDY